MERGSASNTPAVGIDLGTTYSCVGVWQKKHGSVYIVANDQGRRITRSCVSFNESERLIGDAAFNDGAENASNTIYAVKRLIGRAFSDDHVKDDIKLWPFNVICGPNNKPNIVVKYKGVEKHFTAEEISSMILARMKEVAEAYLGCPVKKAVVTVPAYFNNQQRQSTIDAGTIAGLDVLRIIDEPTAAAIAYGFDKMTKNSQTKNVIVFDLGGGTFDVSLVSMNHDSVIVKATAGDTHLGGEDFDNRMVKYFINEFKRKYQKDITGNRRAMWKLRSACEQAKINLSSQKRMKIQIDSLYDNIDFSSTISQAQFNDINEDLFEKCMDILKQCMIDAKIEKKKIDAVVLVGGSARIPKVQQLLQEYFEGIPICKDINPDEAVAYGATIQAAKLTSQGNTLVQDMVVVDVTPLSLGTGIIGGKMSTIVPRNTRIPTTMTSQYSTAEDDQTGMTIDVYEGERAQIKENNLLGKFQFYGIPPAPRGVGKVDVSFEIDANGILIVSAVNEATGTKQKVTITNENGRLSDKDKERMVREAERFKADDEEYKRQYEAWGSLEKFVYDMKKASRAANVSRKESLSAVIERASKLVVQDPLPRAADSNAMMQELRTICCSFGLCD